MATETMQELQFPLSVNLASMSQRSRAVIEYYIKNGKNQFFSIASSADTADIVMLDYDHPSAAAILAKRPWSSSNVLILLTVSQNNVDGAIMVRKPLNSTGLDGAAVKALNQLKGRQTGGQRPPQSTRPDTPVPQQTPATPRTRAAAQPSAVVPERVHNPEVRNQSSTTGNPVQPTPAPHALKTPSYFRTIEATLVKRSKLSLEEKFERYAEKIELLCGPQRTLEQLRDPQNRTHRVDLTHCLSRQIVESTRYFSPGLKAVQFKTPDATISVLLKQNKLYSSLSLENKSNVQKLFHDWEDKGFTVIKFDRNSVRQLVDTLNQTKRYSFSLPSFCWLGTLFSAQGRLPHLYDIDTPCRLRRWPNLSRLELIPDCLEIAAAWSNNTATLPQIVDRVRCEPRYVTAFFNAACTLDLMTFNPDHEQ